MFKAIPKTFRRRPRAPRPGVGVGLVLAALALGACGGGGGGSGVVPGAGGSSPRLASLEYGLLADVYGLDKTGVPTLYLKDVLVGPDIQDEREANSTRPNSEITYDFRTADPDTLQPRLLITRQLGSRDFQKAFDALDDQLREIAPAAFGLSSQPFSVAPRNGAFRLTFTHPLGLTEDFFVQRNASGQITGLKNTEAVQLLEITGDPNDPNPVGDFKPINMRIVPRGNHLILDAVLLGTEGLQYQTRNNASGMPASASQSGANIRIALALTGPLAIPGLRPDRVGNLNGVNNSGQPSVIRDFRSGNRNDNTPEISQGFLRDPLPPRIAGQLVMYVERVDDNGPTTQVVTLYKNGIEHEIDIGDSIRLIIDNTGVPAAVTEITTDPSDDAGQPAVQHVRAIVTKQFRTGPNGQQIDIFEDWDPSDPTQSNQFWRVNGSIPPYPQTVAAREPWLVQYAPRGVLVAEFTAQRTDPSTGNVTRDDPQYFVTFTPQPLPLASGLPSPPNENISPHASAIVRFTKPVDLSTVKAVDTLFFATRDLLDPTLESAFISSQGIDPQTFVRAKYFTPHLVGASVFDEDGSQTNIRLTPVMGFYLDATMRLSTNKGAFNYFLHVLGGSEGIKDLSGNRLDLQAESASEGDFLVVEFELDARNNQSGQPLFPDNLAVTVARRFEDPDEDEQPSYYQRSEVQEAGKAFNEKAFNLPDLFGAVVHLADGTLSARQTARVRHVVDDINQQSPPPQSTPGRFCPERLGGEAQVISASAGAKFGSPLQNPLNPFGCRLQTLWREIDMSLSRTDPLDFNLDVEQLYWAPFTGLPVVFDEFDRMSLFLDNSEWRPEPCVGAFGALPSLPNSGLDTSAFTENVAYNFDTKGTREPRRAPHTAYVDKSMLILPSLAILEINGVNRYLSLPKFDKPYFVWRDERDPVQGANSKVGLDTTIGGNSFAPYILSPFLTGRGRFVTKNQQGGPQFNAGAWDNRDNFMINRTGQRDGFTGGLVGSTSLPLLADFWTYPDSASLPQGNPFRASGVNGWQISLAVQSSPIPNFRAYSAGGLVQGAPRTVDPTSPSWVAPSGGFTPTGQGTRSADNSVFWIMADYVKRTSVATAGFVEILDPHRTPSPPADPRLGPYFNKVMPADRLPNYQFVFEPPLQSLPGGTNVIAEFRGAGVVDTLSSRNVQGQTINMPWAAAVNNYTSQHGSPAGSNPQEPPNTVNFPLDPLKAGDAHIRKYDDRLLNGTARNTWTYYYNRNVTNYTLNPNDLANDQFTNQFGGASELFLARDVTYINWRFIFENNVDGNPPVSPVIDSFVLTYRLEKTK